MVKNKAGLKNGQGRLLGRPISRVGETQSGWPQPATR